MYLTQILKEIVGVKVNGWQEADLLLFGQLFIL